MIDWKARVRKTRLNTSFSLPQQRTAACVSLCFDTWIKLLFCCCCWVGYIVSSCHDVTHLYALRTNMGKGGGTGERELCKERSYMRGDVAKEGMKGRETWGDERERCRVNVRLVSQGTTNPDLWLRSIRGKVNISLLSQCSQCFGTLKKCKLRIKITEGWVTTFQCACQRFSTIFSNIIENIHQFLSR